MSNAKENISYNNVLVLGNGFDIAHGYKTKYEDFFKFLNKFKYLITGVDPKLSNAYASPAYLVTKGKNTLFSECNAFFFNGSYDKNEKAFYGSVNNKVFLEALESINRCIFNCDGVGSENIWYRYLDDKLKESKNSYKNIGWSGIEEEVRKIINGIDADMASDKPYPLMQNSLNGMNPILRYFKYIDNDRMKNYRDEKNAKLGYFRRMSKDLERLTIALEIYLNVFVRLWNQQVKKIKIFEHIKVDSIINFNYTDTYSDLYDNKCKTFYIHGRACLQDDGHETNLIMGIDESKESDSMSFIDFRKFYQRIVRGSDMSYEKELEKGMTRTIFYGHSISDIDRDVIAELLPNIGNNKIEKSIICAHDEARRMEYTANVAKIIGKDKLVELTRGKNARLSFILIDKLPDILNC